MTIRMISTHSNVEAYLRRGATYESLESPSSSEGKRTRESCSLRQSASSVEAADTPAAGLPLPPAPHGLSALFDFEFAANCVLITNLAANQTDIQQMFALENIAKFMKLVTHPVPFGDGPSLTLPLVPDCAVVLPLQTEVSPLLASSSSRSVSESSLRAIVSATFRLFRDLQN